MQAAKLLLILLVLTLGCIGGGEAPVTYSADGVKILSFETDVTEITSGSTVNTRVQIQNVGQADATEVSARFFKFGDFKASDGNPLTNGGEYLWPSPLDSPSPSANLPGQIAEHTWKLTSPTVTGKSTRVNQELGLAVSYLYSSWATLELPVLSTETYLEYQQTSKLPTKTMSSSQGPVSISFDTQDYVYGDEDPFVIQVTATKGGSGYIESDSADCEAITGIPHTTGMLHTITLTYDSTLTPNTDDCDFDEISTTETILDDISFDTTNFQTEGALISAPPTFSYDTTITCDAVSCYAGPNTDVTLTISDLEPGDTYDITLSWSYTSSTDPVPATDSQAYTATGGSIPININLVPTSDPGGGDDLETTISLSAITITHDTTISNTLELLCPQLYRSGELKVSCEFNPDFDGEDEIYPVVEVHSTYRFVTEASAQLLVKGK